MENKTKHINIRLTPDKLRQIERIQKQVNGLLSFKISRSQVIEHLITKGMENLDMEAFTI